MRSEFLYAEGDYLRINIQGIARVDATKLNFNLLDREENPSTPPIYRWLFFVEIENMSNRTWEWGHNEWDLNDGEEIKPKNNELMYVLDQIPRDWDMVNIDIPPGEAKRTIFVYEDTLDQEADWVLSYRKMVAEGWYDSIERDDDVHITEFTDQYEEIKLVISTESREELLWENHIEYAKD